ncbi:cupin domain-containing protein [Pelagicoccus sp. SDUM812003]|uniref:cupin domain-containing protein n=1 Tax=Pelagicoccus sp. SDUM812003 TaxID=3041267 RepID=UPI00280FC68F|nr:cupin domain-containing protein [Pelagicoccus sp. SDUM812003]MDQ8205660.1 cupin domain-containing protein [Pelagicoccus sp. SDUM812003]
MNTLATSNRNQTLRVINPTEGRGIWVLNDYQIHKLSGADTGQALSLFFANVAPGEGPPPHIHEREDEIFIVLEGKIEFASRDTVHVAGPNSVVFAPRGQQHSFRNCGDAIARMAVILTPAGFENFFAEVGLEKDCPHARPSVAPEEIEQMLQCAARYGLTFCS